MPIADESLRSGAITRDLKGWVKTIVEPGAGYLETCDRIEREIVSRGGRPAFPTGIGVNDVTAHYAPPLGDDSKFAESDVIKVDFGVQIDGYVTDTAVTVTFNPEYEALLEATERALAAAIEVAKKERRTGEIGKVVAREAAKYGFKTIENLTGHTIERYVVHAGKSIPNVYVPNMQQLKAGEVFAIEPFLTLKSAAGYVVDAPTKTIFSIATRKNTGSKELDDFVSTVWDERRTLPFTPRWYSDRYRQEKLNAIIGELVKKRILRSYPTLVEASGRQVAQFEHTVAIDDGGLVILT